MIARTRLHCLAMPFNRLEITKFKSLPSVECTMRKILSNRSQRTVLYRAMALRFIQAGQHATKALVSLNCDSIRFECIINLMLLRRAVFNYLMYCLHYMCAEF